MSPLASLLARLLALLLPLLLALPPCASGAETLVLNTAHSAPLARPDGRGFEDRIVAEAFRRIGVAVRLVILPAERAIQNANQGIDDGSYTRVAGLERQFSNMIMVPEPVSEYLFAAFIKHPGIRVCGWQDLKPHHVGIVVGLKHTEANTAGVRSLTKVRDEEALFNMLDRGRVDVVVAELRTGHETIRRLGLKGIRSLEPLLARQDMFIYLHKKHAALVPRLAEALRQMKRDGSFERLTRLGLGTGLAAGGDRPAQRNTP